MNNIAQENNLQYCLDLCGLTLRKEITFAILAYGFFHRNIVYTMLPKYVWDNIAQENYLCIVGPECTDILSQENWLFQICLVACFLTRYNTTKQSWLFLFNVGLGVHLQLMGQQWTGVTFDWNIVKHSESLILNCIYNIICVKMITDIKETGNISGQNHI